MCLTRTGAGRQLTQGRVAGAPLQLLASAQVLHKVQPQLADSQV